jgi:hypothetical protein
LITIIIDITAEIIINPLNIGVTGMLFPPRILSDN